MNIDELHLRFRRYCAVEEGLSINTLRDLKSTMGTFLKRTEAVQMNDISPELLRAFFYEGKEKYQWSFYRYDNYRKYLNKFLNWCVRRDHLKVNPLLGLGRPKRPSRLPRRLTQEEAQRILAATFSHPWRYPLERPRNFAIIATFLYAGIRRGELLALELADINLDAGTLLVRRGKGDKDRYVPVHFKLRRILEAYLRDRTAAGHQGGRLFIGARGSLPLGISGVRAICRKVSQSAGVHFTPHRLRHTFASVAVEQAVPLVKIQQILGHSDIHSTMIYLRMSPQSLSAGLNAVDLF